MDQSVFVRWRRAAVFAAAFGLLFSDRSSAQSLDRQGLQWAPYLEWTLPNDSFQGNPFDLAAKATFVHDQSGERRVTGMFYDGRDGWRFRFTATRPGRWTFATESRDPELDGRRGTIEIQPNDGAYGFVTHVGARWARPRGAKGELEAFTPQYVMYAHPGVLEKEPQMIDRDIQTFFVDHGFNGFHVPVLCRWFDIERDNAGAINSDNPNPDPRTFAALELLIAKTHAAGGVVHLWCWGDEMRRQTPVKWGLNGQVDRRLQRYIAARLGPLPGWTMGYGFDLWEWVDDKPLADWRNHMHAQFGWPHLLGARSQKNELTQLSEAMDYASYEQHRPDYAKYVESIERRPGKPSFSEDRFRIRQSPQYADKDYDFDMTRRGLWHSTMAGGVANIWGNLSGDFAINSGDRGSLPYPRPELLKCSAEFFRGRFLLDMRRDNALTDGVCLRTPNRAQHLFYKEDVDSIRLDLSGAAGSRAAIAVDARKKYEEIDLGALAQEEQVWQAPHKSNWAIAVGRFDAR